MIRYFGQHCCSLFRNGLLISPITSPPSRYEPPVDKPIQIPLLNCIRLGLIIGMLRYPTVFALRTQCDRLDLVFLVRNTKHVQLKV